MDPNNIVSFVDHLYENIDIYHTLLAYPDDFDERPLVQSLLEKDYPICEINDLNISSIDDLEKEFRLFTFPVSMMKDVITTKASDLSSISVIICITDDVYQSISKMLNEASINVLDKIYIFSCNKV